MATNSGPVIRADNSCITDAESFSWLAVLPDLAERVAWGSSSRLIVPALDVGNALPASLVTGSMGERG